jgi:hypothetical protein
MCPTNHTRSRWQICVYTNGQGRAHTFTSFPQPLLSALPAAPVPSCCSSRLRFSADRSPSRELGMCVHRGTNTRQWQWLWRAHLPSQQPPPPLQPPPTPAPPSTTLTPLLPSAGKGNGVRVCVCVYCSSGAQDLRLQSKPYTVHGTRMYLSSDPSTIPKDGHDALLNHVLQKC